MDHANEDFHQPPFLGRERRELVSRLLANFDEVSDSRTPRWISIEANTGWGKTRIIQEFYRQLAAQRQSNGTYWPSSLAPPDIVPGDMHFATVMRKRVFPEVVRPDVGAKLDWFWWGLACSRRSGAPIQALADDLTQFAQHRHGLEARWRDLATPSARISDALTLKRSEIAETAVGEAVSIGASLVGSAVPGLGVLLLAAKWGVKALRSTDYWQAPRVDATDSQRSDLVDDLAPALERLGSVGLPIVIVVEDLHSADASLVELLARLLAAKEARILVVTTSWRGLLDESDRPASHLVHRVENGRRVRIFADLTISDLDIKDRKAIVHASLANISDQNASKLAATYSNPWALQLATSIGWVSRRQTDLTDADVASLPRDVGGLFSLIWSELPDDVRRILMLAALSTPAGISERMGMGDASWQPSLLLAAAEMEEWLGSSLANLSLVLDRAEDAFAWIREIDEWIQEFHDPGQSDVAYQLGKIEYSQDERRSIYTSFARRMAVAGAESDSQDLHRNRLLVALASEGVIDWDHHTLNSAVTLCSNLMAHPDFVSQRQVVMVSEEVFLHRFTSEDDRTLCLKLSQLYGDALGQLGRVSRAVQVCEKLLADLDGTTGRRSVEGLRARGSLGWWLGQAGRWSEATVMYQELLKDRSRLLGPRAVETLRTRHNAAWFLNRQGRTREAVREFEILLRDQVAVLGPDSVDTISTQHRLAWCLGEVGRVEEAISIFESVIHLRMRTLGPDSLETLNSRNNLAWWLARSGRTREASRIFNEVLADRARLLGQDAPDTLTTRHRLGEALQRAGKFDQAVAVYEAVLADRVRVLGEEAPGTLITRFRLAESLVGLGQTHLAIRLFETLISDSTRLLGHDAAQTLEARGGLAWCLSQMGNLQASRGLLEQLLSDQERVLGRESPHALNTRYQLAWCLSRAGAILEAIANFEQIRLDQIGALGARAPETLATRYDLAWCQSKLGNISLTIEMLEPLLIDQVQVLGEDAPSSLITKDLLQWSRSQLSI